MTEEYNYSVRFERATSRSDLLAEVEVVRFTDRASMLEWIECARANTDIMILSIKENAHA